MKNVYMKDIVVAFAALASAAILSEGAPQARPDDYYSKKMKDAASQSAKAAKAFEAIMQVPDKSIPSELLARAKAIAVFPQVIKVALSVGGEGGRGVVSERHGTVWGNPVFIRGGGPSFGAQVGASSTDFFLLLMNAESVDGLMKDRFELGAEAGVAAGPVGRNAGAGTDALMHAEILSYSRSRGIFAGVNVKGIVLKPEDDLNTAVYHKTARELLQDPIFGQPDDALAVFPQTLGRYADGARASK